MVCSSIEVLLFYVFKNVVVIWFVCWFERYGPFLRALNQKIRGDPLNSLFREGLHLVLDWSKIQPPNGDPETIKCLSDSVRLIMVNLIHPEGDVTKENLV